MLYLLDANVLIDAERDYYSPDQVPEFWEWLVYVSEQGLVKVPYEIYMEISQGNDELSHWTKRFRQQILLDESVQPVLVRRVIYEGYANDLNDEEIEKDPILLAYAMADLGSRTVVTTEVSKPRRIRANRHIPDVCRDLSIDCCGPFVYTRKLNFTTKWKSG